MAQAGRCHSFRLRRRWLILVGRRHRRRARAKVTVGALLFLVSFGVKSLHTVDVSPVMNTSEQLAGGMAAEYDREAVAIWQGQGILLRDNWDSANTSLLMHAPGYAILLSGIYALFGRDYFTVQFVQNAANSLSPILIFLIAANLVSWRVGMVAGLLAALSHHLAYYSTFILPDSVCALPILFAVYLLVKARRSRDAGIWPYALAGLCVGISVWLRPNALLMGPFLFVLLAWAAARRRQFLRRAWALALMPLLFILPITLRNYLLYGEFVLISINTGIVLWEGIGEAGGGRFGAVVSDGEVAMQEAEWYNDPRYAGGWAAPDGIRRDRDRIRRSLDVISHNPLWFARAMLWRVGQMVKYSAQAPLVYRSTDTAMIEAGERARQAASRKGFEPPPAAHWSLQAGKGLSGARPIARALQRIAKETMLVFILVGALTLFLVSRRRFLWIAAVPLYYMLVQSTMHTEFRYTLPMHYFLFALAATTWVLIGSMCRRGIAWAGKRTLSYRQRGSEFNL